MAILERCKLWSSNDVLGLRVTSNPVDLSNCGVHSLDFPVGSLPATSMGPDRAGRACTTLEAIEDGVSLLLRERILSTR